MKEKRKEGGSCSQPLQKSITQAKMETAGRSGKEGKREQGDGNTKGR